jgi:DNA polymerase-4
LVDSFGSSYGNYLYHASRGIDDSPLITDWEPKSISRETTFQNDIANWQSIAKTLADLTREVVTDMKDSGVKARTVTIKVRFSDFETVTRATTIPHASDKDEEIRKAAFACLKRVELKRRVRLIGMRASHLERMGD